MQILGNEIDNNSVLTKEAILELIVAFAFIDNELHPKEANALREICESLEISLQQLEAKIEENLHTTENREERCYKAFEAIESKYARERLVGLLVQIATSDHFHHEDELKFLNAIKNKWGLEISIGRQFVWDEDQKAVVHADYRERMIVYAGPGMGKTAVACARVSELIDQNVEPNNIWMLSFTRTAVKEIRDRISSFADHNLSSLGVKVGTIDSKAWRIRYGLSDDEIKNLFGDYEQNIKSAVRLFDEKKDDIYESFHDLEHVVIDEAQDITDARAELLIKILGCLNPDCGITIFADPAQAIYGFIGNDDSRGTGERYDFLEHVKLQFGTKIQEKELKVIHRTKNHNLVKLIEDLRLDIFVNDNIDETHYTSRENFIKEQAGREVGEFDSKEFSDNDHTLVLFRRRPEVLYASEFACRDGVSHRIRMSGHPHCIFSWVGHVFYDYPRRTITKDQFFDICREKVDLFESVTNESTYEDWWSILLETAKKNDYVDITRLRTVLSRNPPPINFCYPDSGNKGPILGTIHASKGREADNVVLKLPVRNQTGNGFNYDEESRVLYVGATRARDELVIGRGYAGQTYAKSLDSGRAYNHYRAKGYRDYRLATVEVGLRSDLDEFSFVSTKRSLQDVLETQEKLARLARRTPYPLIATLKKYRDKYIYNIWSCSYGTEADTIIGEFNASFNDDLFQIACSFGKYNSPREIRREPFYMLGLRTICRSENDPNLKTIHEPYSKTGIWIVPVIIGYPRCLFPARRRNYY